MSKFRVTFKLEVYASLEVEDENKDEAQYKAFENLHVQTSNNGLFVCNNDEFKRGLMFTGEVDDYDKNTYVEEI
jgi:hypothetical protein